MLLNSTFYFRSQEEKLSEHLQKVAELPDLNIKIEKLGRNTKIFCNLYKWGPIICLFAGVKLKDMGEQLGNI